MLKLAETSPTSVQENFCQHSHILSLLHVCSESYRRLCAVLLLLLVQVDLVCRGRAQDILQHQCSNCLVMFAPAC